MLKTHTRDTMKVLSDFARHPLDEIAHLPNWGLKHLIVLQIVIAAVSGVLAGLLNPGLWKILQGLLLFPFVAIVMNLLLTSFFYYSFQIFERRTISFVRILTLIVFAGMPFFLFHIASNVFIIADLIGLAMMSILLIIGLTENFGLPKKRSMQVIGLIFGLLFLLWLAERISSSSLSAGYAG